MVELAATLLGALLLASPVSAAWPRGQGVVAPVTEVCSISGVVCAYAYSVAHRVVAGATRAFQLYNKTTTATQDIGFDGAGKVDVASALIFCGTVANCAYKTIYDQTGSGCDPTQATAADMMTYQLNATNGNIPEMRIAAHIDGRPGYPAVPGLYTVTGCSALPGDSAKTIIMPQTIPIFLPAADKSA